jgi:hypothetical protein
MTGERSRGVMCPYHGILKRIEGVFAIRYEKRLKDFLIENYFGREIVVPVDNDTFVKSEMDLSCLCGYNVSLE